MEAIAHPVLKPSTRLVKPDTSALEHLITEDDEPVDNIFSAKQQRLLVSPLYSSWQPGRPFLADSNVGVFSDAKQSPIVPDMFLSMDVEITEDWFAKEHRSYFIWEFGKPPEVAVEVVSNKEGEEAGSKIQKYARLGVRYYAIYDPQRLIQPEYLRFYELRGGRYQLKPDNRLEQVGLSLTLWQGTFEEWSCRWLRWCGLDGRLIPTGDERAAEERERAAKERERADQERERADQERERADQGWARADQERERADQGWVQVARERERADRLLARLRALGLDPDEELLAP
jgi:Uma2 family endonuclease